MIRVVDRQRDRRAISAIDTSFETSVVFDVVVRESARRREGIGRALLARVEAHGKELGAERVWLETTSVNVPGVTAYARLGYALVGLDTTVYDTLPYADETALYLAKRL